MGGSSSQPRTNPPRSPINAFSIEELYTTEFSESLQENTGYWQQPNPYEAMDKHEEIALAKGWRAVSENSQHGNARKKNVFWCEVLAYIESKTKMEGLQTYDMVESVAGDEYYVQKKMIHYQAETRLSIKFHHCWDALKDSPKFKEIAFPNFNQGEKARSTAKNKGSTTSRSSTMKDDALDRLVVNEMIAAEV
nr:hypothetical protein [Tanacetum cinerariifolium]